MKRNISVYIFPIKKKCVYAFSIHHKSSYFTSKLSLFIKKKYVEKSAYIVIRQVALALK